MITKTLPFLVLGYVVSPLDFIPDVIPIVGQLDDLGILAIGITVFLKLCPGDAVHFHRASIEASRPYTPMPAGGEIIDAEFRRQ